MKRLIPALLACLLLCGCTAEDIPAETATVPPTVEAAPAPQAGTYDPLSTLEDETHGAVKVYPLHFDNVRGIHPMGESLLVFSGGEYETTITQLTGDTLFPESSFTAQEYLSMTDIAFHGSSISWFSESLGNVTAVMDIPLRMLRSIEAPEEMTGKPVLSPDGSTLYYCTAGLMYAMDLESGISRVLKEISYGQQTVTSTHLGGSIVQLTGTNNAGQWRSLYLSAENGRILWEDSGELMLYSADDHYFCNYFEGTSPMHLFGTTDGNSKELLPLHPDALCSYLPDSHAAVTVACIGKEQVLDYYDLECGLRTGTLSFPADYPVRSISTGPDGTVYFLCYSDSYGCDVLYCWDPVMSLTGDTAVYTAKHYTADNPDHPGLEECAVYARSLSEKYGIEIGTYLEAVSPEPAGCTLEPEHNVTIIRRELELLDQRLQHFPDGFLQTLAEQFGSIRICIVRDLKASDDSLPPEEIQFWDGQTASIFLNTHADTEYALYHALSHLIDSVILTQSNAYDRWDTLNPKEFQYDNNYLINSGRDGSQYLKSGSESFIDTYAMSFAKEDRARIMEYAMTGGNEAAFQSRAMQKKLLTLCEGIRDAFGLKKSPKVFLWEQYLTTSLAYAE